jgi:hypothetical protein
VKYAIDRAGALGDSIVVVTMSGKAEPGAIVAMLDELGALATSAASLRVLIDESDLDPALLGPDDIRRFRNQWTASPKLAEARVAIFAPGAVMYGLNRMFQLMRDSERLAVFRDREKAILWVRSST